VTLFSLEKNMKNTYKADCMFLIQIQIKLVTS